MCVYMCKSMSKKMNVNESERVYEQEHKYEYGHKCWWVYCESEQEFNYEYLSKYCLNGISSSSISRYKNVSMRMSFKVDPS